MYGRVVGDIGGTSKGLHKHGRSLSPAIHPTHMQSNASSLFQLSDDLLLARRLDDTAAWSAVSDAPLLLLRVRVDDGPPQLRCLRRIKRTVSHGTGEASSALAQRLFLA